MNEPNPIAAWFATMQESVVNLDHASARNMFDPNVIGFGSRTAVEGINFLERDQWRLAWPRLRSFTFNFRPVAAAQIRLSRFAVITSSIDSSCWSTS